MGAVVHGVQRLQGFLVEGVQFGHSQHIGFGHVNHSHGLSHFGQRCPRKIKKSQTQKRTKYFKDKVFPHIW
jgi:hypothetical protein